MSESPPDGPGPASPWDAFSQGGEPSQGGAASPGGAALPPPGPGLTALTGDAVANLAQLTDDQLLGAGSAARRLVAYAGYLELMAVAEFGRRRDEQLEASRARGDRVRSRDGEYAAEELGFELAASAYSAAIVLDLARNVAGRLPATLAGMKAGLIDRDRARVISNVTLHLPGDLATAADAILAPAAPGLRVADLARKAAVLEARLDPDGVRARKEHARRSRRVELRREDSGAASLSGRELDPADALCGKASIDAEAVRLRRAGLPGTLDQIRALVMMDRVQLRDPWERLAPLPEPDPDYDPETGQDPETGHDPDPAGGSPASPDCDDPGPDDPGPDDPGPDDPGPDDPGPDSPGPDSPDCDDPDYDGPDPGHDDAAPDDAAPDNAAAGDAGEEHPAGRAPLPALVNITIPAGTLLGWSATPADIGGWGLLDASAIRDLIASASRHPRTRWCYTITSPQGEAIAHACARGPHPWPPPDTPPPDTPPAARLAALLAALHAIPEPIARGTCDHAHREDRYAPGRTLKHLIRARTATCPAPGCGAQAATGHTDHTTPYPAGDTCQHNLSPPCPRHHHAKHAPGWTLTQPRPGHMQWTTPSGRTYTTHPTRYDQ